MFTPCDGKNDFFGFFFQQALLQSSVSHGPAYYFECVKQFFE